jgi:Fe-S-cluster-containing hydrogenase component 2
MIRKVIQIDREKCNGCGLCANACHEGAIGMVDGKAQLLRDDYCDGLGDCLPACPTGAITFVEREAKQYDHHAVLENRAKKFPAKAAAAVESRLSNWPVQLKLAPVQAPYFEDGRLLIAADCTAFSFGNFHPEFMEGRVTLIGCPKLDMVDYTEKLTEIFRSNNIRNIQVVRMEVPCCGGLEHAVKQAIAASGKDIPCHVTVLTVDGSIRA